MSRYQKVRYDRHIFRRWLLDRIATAPRKPVGYSNDSSRCPLMECFGQGLDERGYQCPPWADDFIWAIDTRGPNPLRFPPRVPQRVMPREALTILDAILTKTARTPEAVS